MMLHSLRSTERLYSTLAGCLESSVSPTSCECDIHFPSHSQVTGMQSHQPAASEALRGFILSNFNKNMLEKNSLTSHFTAI